MVFGRGISREGDLLDLGVENGLVDKSGAHYTYGETRLGMGRENVKGFLRENRDVAVGLETTLRDLLLGDDSDETEMTANPSEEAVAS